MTNTQKMYEDASIELENLQEQLADEAAYFLTEGRGRTVRGEYPQLCAKVAWLQRAVRTLEGRLEQEGLL